MDSPFTDDQLMERGQTGQTSLLAPNLAVRDIEHEHGHAQILLLCMTVNIVLENLLTYRTAIQIHVNTKEEH